MQRINHEAYCTDCDTAITEYYYSDLEYEIAKAGGKVLDFGEFICPCGHKMVFRQGKEIFEGPLK